MEHVSYQENKKPDEETFWYQFRSALARTQVAVSQKQAHEQEPLVCRDQCGQPKNLDIRCLVRATARDGSENFSTLFHCRFLRL